MNRLLTLPKDALEKGVVHTRVNELMSLACELTVDIYGRSSHIAKASAGLDATAAAMSFYQQMRAMKPQGAGSVTRLRHLYEATGTGYVR